MKRYSAGVDPIELLKEREAILTLLPQTWAGSLHRDASKFTIDPKTRYPNLHGLLPPTDVAQLYDTDNNGVDNTAKELEKDGDDMKEAGKYVQLCVK